MIVVVELFTRSVTFRLLVSLIQSVFNRLLWTRAAGGRCTTPGIDLMKATRSDRVRRKLMTGSYCDPTRMNNLECYIKLDIYKTKHNKTAQHVTYLKLLYRPSESWPSVGVQCFLMKNRQLRDINLWVTELNDLGRLRSMIHLWRRCSTKQYWIVTTMFTSIKVIKVNNKKWSGGQRPIT